MYRAVNEQKYPPENVNTGNLEGVLWYLQHEVITGKVPKFGITRIVRYLVKTKAPQALFQTGMNFGVRYAFDSGQCTGPFDCNAQWNRYGFFVGCNKLGSFPYPQFKVPYANAIWYSLPGTCPSKKWWEKDAECREQAPGGACQEPTGEGSCTYSYELAGEVRLDELHQLAQSNTSLRSFWDRPDDELACNERLRLTESHFDQSYPKALASKSMQAPVCDFDFDRFYH